MVVILKDIIIDKNTIRDVHIKDGQIQYVDPRQEEIERIKNIPEKGAVMLTVLSFIPLEYKF